MSDIPKSKAIPVHIDEVLPPEGKHANIWPEGKRPQNFTEWLTWVLDEAIRVPGTKFRFGLDPLISLFPIFGASASSGVGMWIVFEGVRHRAPISLLLRMSLNQMLNDIGGSIPIVGDIWSAFYKSNSINLALLNRWKAGEHAALKKSSRIVLFCFLAVWLGIMALWFFVWFSLVTMAWKIMRGVFGGA